MYSYKHIYAHFISCISMHHVQKRQHDAYQKQKRFHMFGNVTPKIDDSSMHRSSRVWSVVEQVFCEFLQFHQ